MKGGMAMNKTKNRKKVRKPKRFLPRIAIIVLTILAVLRLYTVAMNQWLEKEESIMTINFDRLYASIVKSQVQTTDLTDTYNNWRYSRLTFLEKAYGSEATDYSGLVAFGERYLKDTPLYLYDTNTDTLIARNAEPLDEEVATGILQIAKEPGDTGTCRQENDQYYYRVLPDYKVIIMRTNYLDYVDFLDNIYTPREVIDRNIKDGDNFFFVVEDGIITNIPYDDCIGKPLSSVLRNPAGENLNLIQSDTAFELQVLQDKPVFMVMQHIDEVDMDLYYVVPFVNIFDELLYVILPVSVVTCFLLIIYSLYLHYLRIDKKYKRLEGGNTRSVIVHKSITLIVTSLLIVAGVAYYARTLYGLSYFIENYKIAFENLKYTVEDSELCRHDLQEDYDKQAVKTAQILGAYFSDYPERRTPEELKKMSEIFGYEYIMMFDTDGKETLTDSDYVGYSISSDPENPSYIFNPLRHGVPYVVGKLETDDLTKQEHQIIGVTTKDTEGRVDGFLQTVYYPANLLKALESSSLVSALRNSVISNVFDVFIIDCDTETITYSALDDMIGEDAKKYGFTKDNLKGNFSGYITIWNQPYFTASAIIKNQYHYVAMETETVFSGRGVFTLNAVIVALLELLVLTVLEKLSAVEKIPELEKQKESDENVKDVVYMVVKDNTPATTAFPLIRDVRRRWAFMKAEERLEVIISRVLLLITVVSTVLLVFRKEIFSNNSILEYIQEGNWPRGINIFSVSAILIMIIIAIVAVTIIKEILNLLATTLTARAETICHLIRSCLEYTVTIGVAYVSLGYLGVDVRALSATVGFLSLIIGFGAKSLITDIVAGIFIIFEGEFQVGDIVEIGGYRGMVKEIGLRTTKLISWDKNVKIINNHDINNVVNMTMRNSFATVNFTIPVTTSIEEVEKVFKEELPKLKQKFPQIIGDPYFAGILSFSGSRMACRITAEVKELERGDIENQLHREVQEILQRNNIPMK